MGLYAFFVVAVFYFLGIDALSFIPKFLLTPVGLTFLSFIVIFIPMFLVGFSIPILAIYMSREKAESSFPYIYGLYATGSALALISLELFLLKSIGIIACLLSIGFLNLILASYLYFYQKDIPRANKEPSSTVWYPVPFILGVLSMLFQFYFIEIVFEIYGTTVSNFSFVLATALLGVAIGSYITTRINLKFKDFLVAFMLISIIPFLFLTQIIYLWSDLFSKSKYVVEFKEIFQVLFIFMKSLMLFSLFGAVVPLFLKHNAKALAKDVLFSNSLGNALGIFLAGFILYPFLDLKYTLVLIILTILGISYMKKDWVHGGF